MVKEIHIFHRANAKSLCFQATSQKPTEQTMHQKCCKKHSCPNFNIDDFLIHLL